MKAIRSIPLPKHLAGIFMLARRLERHENSADRVDAELYRFEARCLIEELRTMPADAALQTLLGLFPATAELYENLHYAHTGLCRSEPAAALTAKMQAKKAIIQAQRRARTKPAR